MGTRSLTVILAEDGKEICTIYRQFDGYPSGQGAALKSILSAGPLVNGIQGDGDCFNGMFDLAAQVIARLKTNEKGKIKAGNVYVYPPGSRDLWEDYIYTVYAKAGKIWLKCEQGPSVLFDGLVEDFDCEKEEA